MKQITETVSMSFGVWNDASKDAEALKELLVLPEIFDGQRRDGDTPEMVKDATWPGAYLAIFRRLNDPIGGVLYIPRGNGIVEQHTSFIEEERGRIAIKCVEASTAAIFMETPATEMITHCPDWHLGSASLARLMGATELFHMERFAMRDGRMQGARVFGATVMQWAWRNHLDYVEIGHRWHEEVFAKIEAHHPDDEVHNAFVGMCIEMGKRHPHKAMAVYNAWASKAGYDQGAVVWLDGQGAVLLDISNAWVFNQGNRVVAAIPKCQPTPPEESSL